MKKQLLFALLLLHAGTLLMAQTTIVQWNFNSVFGNIQANGPAPAPSLGSGSLNLTGGVTAIDVAGFSADTGPAPNRALSTSSYPPSTSSPRTAGIEMSISTTGYNAVHLIYYTRHSNTAANKLVVQYLNGSLGWQTAYSYNVTTAASNIQQNFDLSSIGAVNNNGAVRIRIVTDFATATSYQATNSTSTYGTSGTIQYDLITISGNSLGCGTPATQQATGFRLMKTDNTSAQLTLNRGNGRGCLVSCSQAGIPTAPVDATNYAANSSYGSGAAVGNAFAVYNTQVINPSTHYFNINGLTAGTKYYVAAYEYSSTGYCYLTPALVDSFYCNSTVLYPGDVQFVGYDNNVGSNGRDAFVLTNFKELKKGTSFQIVNSRYEAGAAPNTRTQRWYAGGNNIYQPLQRITLIYSGTSLPAGSIISFRHLPHDADSIKINGSITSDFTINDNLTIGNLLSGTSAEQFFLTQGNFKAFGTANNDLYSLLDGHVLHGISYTNNWVDFSQTCNADTSAASRQSRIPSDIRCLNLFFPFPNNYAFYPISSAHSGSQSFLLGQINNSSIWLKGNGTAVNDIDAGVLTTPFTLTTSPSTANWTGSTNGNWFNCYNWENLYVPDSTSDVTIAVTPTAAINANILPANEYSNLAITRNLNITTGVVTLNGTTADKLIVYDSLLIGSSGSLITSGSTTDTLVVRGSIQSQNTNGLLLSSNGWLALQGNRQLQPINVSLASTTVPVGVSALSLDNPPGININNGGFESLQKLELANGILSTTATAFHYMGAACSISSPINYFGETNKGWLGSFIDGKVYIRTAAASPYTAPLGSKQKGVFAPMVFQPEQPTNRLYVAGYVGTSHPNTSPADINTPPVNHISTQEYWTLTSTDAGAAANITLYYTPLSFIGGRGMDAQALQDLQIVQYWDSSAASPRKWRLPTYPVSFIRPTSTQYDKISMGSGQYATSLSDLDKNFTFGDGNIFNTLPVQLLSWKAALQGNRTKLSWQSKDETGVAYYSVEKSSDGKVYHHLRTIYAAGKNYFCFDDYPTDGWNYYRLKITDIDGKTVYSPVEKVWIEHSPAFSIFPNPALDKVYISLPNATAKGTIVLYAPNGKKCLEQAVANTSFLQLNIKGLTAGWYLVEFSDGKNRLNKKLFIK